MSVPSAGKLREMRDKRKKPIKFKVEFTLKQLKAMSIGLETLIFRGISMNADTLATAQEAQDEIKHYLRKFEVLAPEGERSFESKPDQATRRKYLCSQCAHAVVPEPGNLCFNCSSGGAA